MIMLMLWKVKAMYRQERSDLLTQKSTWSIGKISNVIDLCTLPSENMFECCKFATEKLHSVAIMSTVKLLSNSKGRIFMILIILK